MERSVSPLWPSIKSSLMNHHPVRFFVTLAHLKSACTGLTLRQKIAAVPKALVIITLIEKTIAISIVILTPRSDFLLHVRSILLMQNRSRFYLQRFLRLRFSHIAAIRTDAILRPIFLHASVTSHPFHAPT